MGRVLIVLILVTGLSGCLEALDAAVYQPQEPRPTPLTPLGAPVTNRSVVNPDTIVNHTAFTIVASDGTALAADLWRPGDLEDVPVVIMISPYFGPMKDPNNGNLPPRGSMANDMVSQLVPRGYAVALVDLRGTRESDGCIELGGPNEQQDAYDVVEHFGNLNWTNGKMGMLGVSYDGWTQIMAAAKVPPHLTAIVPIAPITDLYHGVGKGGAKFQGWVPGMALGYSTNQGLGLDRGSPAPPASPAGLLNDPRLRRADAQACAVEVQAWSDDASGLYNDWLKARDLRPMAKDATAAMFYIHGFVDENARPDHIDPWYNDYGGPKRALLWQMDHASPNSVNTGLREDPWFEMLAWFDHHLLDINNHVERTYGTVTVQDSMGRWRVDTAWPPTDAAMTDFPLSAGTILVDADAAPGSEVWRDVSLDSGGVLGSKTTRFMSGSTLATLAFRSETLEESVHYSGRPVVRANMQSDRANSLVVARLYDVLPDGSWVLINEGVQSTLLRQALDAPQPVAPLTTITVNAAMQPGDFVFRPGHAIGVTISSSDQSYVISTLSQATNTLVYGGPEPTALVLPTIERTNFTRTTWGAAQPVWMGPYAWETAP